MKNLVLLCLLAIMALTANAGSMYFEFNYSDTVPLYSRQTESQRYKIGEYHNCELTTGGKTYSSYSHDREYELCQNDKWTKVTFQYDDATSKEKELTAYVPTKYARYKVPDSRPSDGLAAFELLEDKVLRDEYSNNTIMEIPKGSVVVVREIYDTGKAFCTYQNEFQGYISSSNIVATDKEYEVPFYYSSWWNHLWHHDNVYWLIVIGLIALAILCDYYYKRKIFKEGKWYKFLDILAGLLFAAAVVVTVYPAYYSSTGHMIFKDIADFIFLFPKIESGFWFNVALCAQTLLICLVWYLISRFLIFFGSTAIIQTTLTLFYLCTMLPLITESFRTDLWAFLGIPMIGLTALGGMGFVIGLIGHERCPKCHKIGMIEEEGVDYNGTTVEESTEHETVRPDRDTTDTYTYDRYDTVEHYTHHRHCRKCDHRWDEDSSNIINTNRFLRRWKREQWRYE